jgi:hypothetical protein
VAAREAADPLNSVRIPSGNCRHATRRNAVAPTRGVIHTLTLIIRRLLAPCKVHACRAQSSVLAFFVCARWAFRWWTRGRSPLHARLHLSPSEGKNDGKGVARTVSALPDMQYRRSPVPFPAKCARTVRSHCDSHYIGSLCIPRRPTVGGRTGTTGHASRKRRRSSLGVPARAGLCAGLGLCVGSFPPHPPPSQTRRQSASRPALEVRAHFGIRPPVRKQPPALRPGRSRCEAA